MRWQLDKKNEDMTIFAYLLHQIWKRNYFYFRAIKKI